ncbi:asparagine synthase (glutamine-hydrolyzing) [Candidatus Kapabacteria bacterium]|nr:asparagine synthase (glutamine-hydrolyzing) [Candidatus Kapabacteria bacterium]
MCGIAGILDLRSQSKCDLDLLKKMSDIITHRGPDSDGQWISSNKIMGMSFRRLSIIDLSENGTQPMTSPDGRYTISFNGEIYNHQEIRRELESEFTYRGNSDTETILYGFQKYGKDIFQKMHGMWGIAIWDNLEKKLLLCRDRVGIKPLYYYHKDGLLVYGSEIKSILTHPDIKTELNLNELPNYLNYGMSSKNESLFGNIQKLESAHFMEISSTEIRKQRYWHPFDKYDSSQYNQKDVQNKVMDLLRDSVKSRMMSDVPFGVFLSGGIDSSLNVALMAELMDRPIDSFTVGFKELEKFNELEYARKISKKFHTNHHEVLIDEKDSFSILSDLAWHEDEPNSDPVCIPLYFLSKLTKESGTTVIQVGEGSDEQFVGYKWMLQGYKFFNSLWSLYNPIPKVLKKGIYALSKPIMKSFVPSLAIEYMRRSSNNEPFYWSGVSVFSQYDQESLLSDKKILGKPAEYALSIYKEIEALSPNADYLQKVLYLELKQRLAELLLMRVDKITMAHSLESRVPFLDHRLLEFTTSLNEKQRMPDTSISKFILKKSVKDILPHDVIYRKKMGFAAPVDNWFRGPWEKFAEDRLFHSSFAKLGLLDNDYLKSMLKAHQNEKSKLGSKIYSLVNLTLWYDRFF